jgi:hypothetical protein
VAAVHQRRHHRMAQAHRTHGKIAMHRRHHSIKSQKTIALRASHRAPQG